jgi:hypothetical protein
MRFQVVYYVTYGNEGVQILVINNDVELFFAEKNEVGELERVDAEVVCKLSLKTNDVSVYVQFLYKKIFDFFEHCKFLQNFIQSAII